MFPVPLYGRPPHRKATPSMMILYIVDKLTIFLEGSIDCFKCVSVSGSNPACEDPFHNNYTADYLEKTCMGGRKGRNGLFPASACIKIVGSYRE